MAQVDSGLGWSLEEDWLTSVAGARLGYKGRLYWNISGFENQNVPVTGATFSEVSTSGLSVLSDSSTASGNNTWAVGANYDNVLITLKGANGASRPFTFWFVTDKPGVEVYVVLKNRSDLFLRAVCNNQMAGAGGAVYYWGEIYTGAGSSYYQYIFCPATNNLSVQIQNVRSDISIEITKTNTGPAAGGLVKWATSAGVEFKTPILISSVSENVDMTCTSSLYNIAKLNILHQGVRFYMSFFDIPLSVGIQSELDGGVNVPSETPVTLDELFGIIASSSYANILVQDAADPYQQQTGESREDGGDGEDIVDDDVDFTPLPSSMAVASGFITLFCPSQAELNQLASYMWSPLFDVDTFKKLFANPMDCILGLAVYPFPISASGTKTVSVGGVATTVSMGYTLKQYWTVDCGSVYVPKQWGAYMDYAPYTKFNIFLPYIGFRPVSADDIMGKTISLRYMVDILSGACNAELKCGSTVLYSWAGSCAAQIPITGNDWRSAITAGISIAGSVAATVLTQGASAPMIAGTIASATVNSTQLKPEVQRSGSISGSSGFLAGQRPYLVRTNPRSAIPANQNKYSGYPSFVTVLLGNLMGYNEVYSVHLENIPATSAELEEIESILKGGAIF